MKKKLFLLPIFSLLLTGCSFEDLMFWKKKDQTPQEEQKDDKTPGGEDEPGGDTTVHVTSVSLGKTTLSLEEMKSEQLTYTVLPSNATNKNVEWSTSDGTIASVIDGMVYANNPGTATITVTSVDGNKTSSCSVTVTEKAAPEVSTVDATLDFTEKYYSKSDGEMTAFTLEQVVDKNVTVTFSQGVAPSNYPKCYAYNKVSAVRVYAGNQFTITSKENIRKVEFTYQSAKDNPNLEIASQPDGFEVDTWTGSAKEIIFTTDKDGSGYRGISAIKVTYEGEASTEEDINLGVKTIAEVKEYIAEHPVQKNSFGNGVNEHRTITIKGFALAKIDLVKFKAEFGLDVSEHGKVIMADATGSIGVASKVNNEGTSLWGKVGDHVCKSTSKYVVTGYISEYLGHPEILVTNFQWDSSLDISWSAELLSEETVSLTEFYEKAADVNYNCAGHAYGQVLKLTNLKLYYTESDGQGVRYYNFTDGSKNIRVNAFNISSKTVGKYYDVIGITSIKNFSPIIVAFDISETENPDEFTFNFATASQSTTLADLYTIHGSQKDVDTRINRFDEVIEAYGNFYKTTGYLTLVKQDGLYYVGISETFLSNVTLEKPITGKDNACTNYGVTLIKNDDFWAAKASEIERYNPFFEDYVCENLSIEIYYTVRQQRYVSNTPIWEILLIQDSLYVYSD